MDKENVVYIHSGILLSYKKKEILLLVATWMNLEDVMLSEINQTQKDKKLPYLICMWNLQKFSKQKQRVGWLLPETGR